MIAEGLSVAEIAKRFHFAASIIKTHVQNLHKRAADPLPEDLAEAIAKITNGLTR
jgi:transposase